MPPSPSFVYQGTQIFRIGSSSAYTYKTSHVTLDADGCPRAYHPNDTGLDALANAGFPHGGWRNVLVVDPHDHNRPFVQPSGPTAGFFVSKTSLVDPNLAETDPNKYVDAETVPYIVFPGAFHDLSGTGTWGDGGSTARPLEFYRAALALAIVGDWRPLQQWRPPAGAC